MCTFIFFCFFLTHNILKYNFKNITVIIKLYPIVALQCENMFFNKKFMVIILKMSLYLHEILEGLISYCKPVKKYIKN